MSAIIHSPRSAAQFRAAQGLLNSVGCRVRRTIAEETMARLREEKAAEKVEKRERHASWKTTQVSSTLSAQTFDIVCLVLTSLRRC